MQLGLLFRIEAGLIGPLLNRPVIYTEVHHLASTSKVKTLSYVLIKAKVYKWRTDL